MAPHSSSAMSLAHIIDAAGGWRQALLDLDGGLMPGYPPRPTAGDEEPVAGREGTRQNVLQG